MACGQRKQAGGKLKKLLALFSATEGAPRLGLIGAASIAKSRLFGGQKQSNVFFIKKELIV